MQLLDEDVPYPHASASLHAPISPQGKHDATCTPLVPLSSASGNPLVILCVFFFSTLTKQSPMASSLFRTHSVGFPSTPCEWPTPSYRACGSGTTGCCSNKHRLWYATVFAAFLGSPSCSAAAASSLGSFPASCAIAAGPQIYLVASNRSQWHTNLQRSAFVPYLQFSSSTT